MSGKMKIGSKYKVNCGTSLTIVEDNKLKIMLYAQRKKYSQEPFRSKMLATEDCHIEEGNYWNDLYWGTDLKTRKGENKLGKIIRQVRNELMGE